MYIGQKIKALRFDKNMPTSCQKLATKNLTST